MCVSPRFITNPFLPSHKNKILVDCGHCPACQQAKANKRTARIKLHSSCKDIFAVFVTLTYSNDALPYIRLSDVNLFEDERSCVPVYRNCSYYYTRTGRLEVKEQVKVVGTVYTDDENTFYSHDKKTYDIKKITRLNKNTDFTGLVNPVDFSFCSNDVVGIAYKKDLKDFIKRLKINLYRSNLVTENSSYGLHSYYSVSEYGPTTFRPHFHVLLYFENSLFESYADLRRTIIKSWPFCDSNLLSDEIELARNPASYVSAYVNRGSDFPAFLQARQLSPRSSHSRFFGMVSEYFSPSRILESLKRNDYGYNDYVTGNDGNKVLTRFPYPSFVSNFYFPKFKGFSQFSLSKIYDFLTQPWSYAKIGYINSWTYDEYLSNYSLFKNAVYRLGVPLYDYAYWYIRYLSLSNSNLMIYQYCDIPNNQAYDNFSDAVDCKVFFDFDFDGSDRYIYTDYAKRPYFVNKDNKNIALYNDNLKIRKQNEYTRNLKQFNVSLKI